MRSGWIPIMVLSKAFLPIVSVDGIEKNMKFNPLGM